MHQLVQVLSHLSFINNKQVIMVHKFPMKKANVSSIAHLQCVLIYNN